MILIAWKITQTTYLVFQVSFWLINEAWDPVLEIAVNENCLPRLARVCPLARVPSPCAPLPKWPNSTWPWMVSATRRNRTYFLGMVVFFITLYIPGYLPCGVLFIGTFQRLEGRNEPVCTLADKQQNVSEHYADIHVWHPYHNICLDINAMI